MWKRRQDSGGGSSTQETERKIVALVAIQPTNIVTIPLTGYNTKKGLAQTTTEKLKGENHISNTIVQANQPICFTIEQRPFFENIQGHNVLEHLVYYYSNLQLKHRSFIDKKDPITILLWCTELKMYLHFSSVFAIQQRKVFW